MSAEEAVKPDEAYFKFLDDTMAPLLKEGVNKVWEDTPEDAMVTDLFKPVRCWFHK